MSRIVILFACLSCIAVPRVSDAQPSTSSEPVAHAPSGSEPHAVSAQPPAGQPNAGSSGGGIAQIGEAIYHVFTRPVHPTFESVAPGGGLTAGVGYTPEAWKGHRLGLDARASVSVKKYWATEANTWWQEGNRYRLEGYVRARDMRQLDFYGLGRDSLEDNQTNFKMLERVSGGTGWFRPTCVAGVGGRLEGLWPSIDSGRSSDLPSLEAIFDERAAPGFSRQPTFAHTQAFVNVNLPCNEFEQPRTGTDIQLSYHAFRDLDSAAANSFDRYDLEVQQRIGLFSRDRRLTLHLLLSGADPRSGNDVPFYLMQTLGGANNLLGVREDFIGGDQTTATLRGFSDFRFRDASLLLLQAEYRMKLWGPLDLTVYADAGDVAPRARDFRVSDLKHDFGVSVSLMRVTATVIRFDFAFGGGEGTHTFFNVGRTLAP